MGTKYCNKVFGTSALYLGNSVLILSLVHYVSACETKTTVRYAVSLLPHSSQVYCNLVLYNFCMRCTGNVKVWNLSAHSNEDEDLFCGKRHLYSCMWVQNQISEGKCCFFLQRRGLVQQPIAISD